MNSLYRGTVNAVWRFERFGQKLLTMPVSFPGLCVVLAAAKYETGEE
jgi:hypothetical protein